MSSTPRHQDQPDYESLLVLYQQFEEVIQSFENFTPQKRNRALLFTRSQLLDARRRIKSDSDSAPD